MKRTTIIASALIATLLFTNSSITSAGNGNNHAGTWNGHNSAWHGGGGWHRHWGWNGWGWGWIWGPAIVAGALAATVPYYAYVPRWCLGPWGQWYQC